MRIIHLVRSLASGGGERLVVELSNCQAAMGHDVTVCMLEDPAADPARAALRDALAEGVRFLPLCIPGRWSPGEMMRVSRRIRDLGGDILHLHMCGIWYLLPLLLRPVVSDPAIVETIHTLPSRALTRKWEKNVMERLYRAKRIHPVVLSAECAEDFDRLYAPTPRFIIANGRSAITPSQDFPAVAREVAGLRRSPEAPVLIHLGRCHEAKNQECLIRAFNSLRAEGRPMTLLMLGRGYNSAAGKRLQALACRDIHFLGEKHCPGDYLLNSDYLCLSSIYEGMPVSIIEALACGVTPVCTPVGGIPEMLTDGVTGYVSSSCSVADYAETLKRALGRRLPSPTLAGHYASTYAIEHCARRYLELYEGLLYTHQSTAGICAYSI